MTGSRLLRTALLASVCSGLTVLSIVPAAQAGGTEASRKPTLVGRQIADFMLPDTAGKPIALHDFVGESRRQRRP